MDAEKINLLLEAWSETFNQVCQADLKKIGNLFLRQGSIPVNNIHVSIGMTKAIRGEVSFSMDEKTACAVASAMMFGMPVEKLDDMSKSAISELGNMMMGKTASKFASAGLMIDITPPMIITGENMHAFMPQNTRTICIPMQVGTLGGVEVGITVAA